MCFVLIVRKKCRAYGTRSHRVNNTDDTHTQTHTRARGPATEKQCKCGPSVAVRVRGTNCRRLTNPGHVTTTNERDETVTTGGGCHRTRARTKRFFAAPPPVSVCNNNVRACVSSCNPFVSKNNARKKKLSTSLDTNIHVCNGNIFSFPAPRVLVTTVRLIRMIAGDFYREESSSRRAVVAVSFRTEEDVCGGGGSK